MYVVMGETKAERDQVELVLRLFRVEPERKLLEMRAKLEKVPEILKAIGDFETRSTPAVTGDPKANPDGEGIYQAGRDGVGIPRCIYCPSPSSSDEGADARYEGTIVLRVVIGADGAILRVAPVRGGPFSMTRNGMDIVRTWKLAPAKKDGLAVPVHLLVEVVFRQHQSFP